MALMITVLYLAFLSSLVSAQCSGSTTITKTSDADAISSCSTFDGDIVISSTASGDIYLNGIDSITGNLTAVNAASLTPLNADKLTLIGGTLHLSDLSNLSAVAFTSLQQVHTLQCIGLPELESLSFDTGLTEAEDIYISDTGLTTFAGTTITTIGSIDLNSNARMETVEFNSLVNSSSSISIEGNAPNVTVQLTSLQAVYGDLTFQNISGLDVSDLQNITGSFTCYSCALPSYKATWVQIVGGDLAFVGSDLQTLKFPSLTTVGGGFQMSNNSQLTELSTFPWLASVYGSMTLHGVFHSADFPSLDFVQGYLDIETTSSNSTICSDFKELYSTHDLKGGLDCQLSVSQSAASSIEDTNSGTNSTDSSNTTTLVDDNSSGHSSGLKGGAITGIVVGALLLLLGITLAIFFYRRHSRKKPHRSSELDADGLVSYTQSSKPPKEGTAEMYVDPRNVAEMRAHGRFPVELAGNKSDTNRATVREIPGVHEAEDIKSPISINQQRTNTIQELSSPVSTEEITNNSGSATMTATTKNASEDGKTTKSLS